MREKIRPAMLFGFWQATWSIWNRWMGLVRQTVRRPAFKLREFYSIYKKF